MRNNDRKCVIKSFQSSCARNCYFNSLWSTKVTGSLNKRKGERETHRAMCRVNVSRENATRLYNIPL